MTSSMVPSANIDQASRIPDEVEPKSLPGRLKKRLVEIVIVNVLFSWRLSTKITLHFSETSKCKGFFKTITIIND